MDSPWNADDNYGFLKNKPKLFLKIFVNGEVF